MKKVNVFSLILGAILILSSCSTSNGVVSSKLISKRKYTKGYHFNKKSNLKTSKNEVAENEVIKTSTYSVNTVNHTADKNVENSVPLIDKRTVVAETGMEEELLPLDPDFNDVSVKDEDDTSTEFMEEENQNSNTLSKAKEVQEIKNSKSSVDPTVMLILMIILAFIIPPLAVFLYEGASGRFWIDLILFVVGLTLGGLIGGLAWLALLAAVIYALLIVIEAI